MKIGIVGTGIAGMACGHYLKEAADVSFYERNDYAGGHTNTVTVASPAAEEGIHIDTGFMVFNHITYPYLLNLFNELQIPTYPTKMSFSVQVLPDKLEYSGSGLNGLFAQRKNIFNVRHIKMLNQIARFNRESMKMLDKEEYSDYTLERYIIENNFGGDMLWRYLIPMSTAIWSTPMKSMVDFPAQTLINFFYNHGFLGLHTQHQWYTVSGGSRTYCDKIMAPFKDNIFLNDPIAKIVRNYKSNTAGDSKVMIATASGRQAEYDKVIVACHADEALAMLDAPTEYEKRLLGKFRYEKNLATLHTDGSVMPQNKRVWSSWNTRVEEINGKMHGSCTYWMNSLQNLPGTTNFFVTLNDPDHINQSKILKRIEYTHPLFDREAIKAQKELPQLNENGQVYFCGSYFKYGFHEDALASAVVLCKKIKPSVPDGK